MAKDGELRVSKGVLQIANINKNGIATYKRCYKEIPDLVNLTANDVAVSITRPNEPVWHQLVRNIKSHDGVEGNYIYDGLLSHIPRVGYQITDAGKKRLEKKAA